MDHIRRDEGSVKGTAVRCTTRDTTDVNIHSIEQKFDSDWTKSGVSTLWIRVPPKNCELFLIRQFEI